MVFSTWYVFALTSLVLYGAWGYWGTRAAGFVNPLTLTFYSSIGVMFAGFVALMLLEFKPESSLRGNSYALLNGLANGVACIFFVAALRRGPAMPVVLITSMYPLVTLLLSLIFLKQGLTMRQSIGMVFALAALVLFSLE